MSDALLKAGQASMPDAILDRLMPMHLRLCAQGRIRHAGPTIAKMLGTDDVTGCDFFDKFMLRRPADPESMPELLAEEGRALKLVMHHTPDITLRGTIARLADGAGAILDLSLGLSFARAVAEFNLTLNDFSPCDQTVDLLYLYEANSSTTRLSRHLTERLQAAHAAAQHQARTDVLTGLANRRSMDQDLDRLLRDPDEHFAILHVDLDLFKEVNDTHGHAAGDTVLQAVGRIFFHELRRNDKPARIGGDEFLIVLRDAVELNLVGRIAQRLIARIEEPVDLGHTTCRISASIGIASTAQYAVRPTSSEIMADADAALYRAKRAGRGRFATHCTLALGKSESPHPAHRQG